MSTETEDLIRQVITEVNKKYELEAFDEGYALGKQETNESVALKMKGKYPPEEISDITGLNLESIEKL